MRCNFCDSPAAHPSTGCVYGLNTLACRQCVVEAWSWIKNHTSKKARRSSKAVPTELTFYEAAALYKEGVVETKYPLRKSDGAFAFPDAVVDWSSAKRLW